MDPFVCSRRLVAVIVEVAPVWLIPLPAARRAMRGAVAEQAAILLPVATQIAGSASDGAALSTCGRQECADAHLLADGP